MADNFNLRGIFKFDQKFFADLGKKLVVSHKKSVDRKLASPGKEKFTKLSKKYAAQKRKRVGHDKPNLRLTGKMMNSMRVFGASDREVSYGISDSKMAERMGFHLGGTDTMPARPISDGASRSVIYDGQAKEMVAHFAKRIVQNIKRSASRSPIKIRI